MSKSVRKFQNGCKSQTHLIKAQNHAQRRPRGWGTTRMHRTHARTHAHAEWSNPRETAARTRKVIRTSTKKLKLSNSPVGAETQRIGEADESLTVVQDAKFRTRCDYKSSALKLATAKIMPSSVSFLSKTVPSSKVSTINDLSMHRDDDHPQ